MLADLLPREPNSIRMLIIILAIIAVAFWRVSLRIIAILLLVLLALGTAAFLQGFFDGIR